MGQMQPYRSRYGDTITDLLARRGDIAAQGHLASGAIWGNAVGNIGQIAGQAVGDYAQAQQQKEQERQARARDIAIADVLQSDAANDPQALYKALLQKTDPKTAMAMATGAASLMKMSAAKDPQEAMAALPGVARGFMAAPDALKPGLWSVVRERALSAGLAKPEELPEQYDPETAKGYVEFALGMEKQAPEKPQAGFELSPGQTRFDASGKPIASLPPLPEKPKAIPEPSFQAKDVLNDDGKPVMANYDSRTGRYVDSSTGKPIKNPRPVPSAAETQDSRKFQQAGPILRSVSELSEKINTLQGVVASASGAAAKAKAKINLDDDVAEYEALISGFTPLVARALGHTGVLTQQDVDSVKALFPRPEDSKSLRDRKVKRIKGIIGELEGGIPGTAPATVGRFKVEVE